jgi:hypothetical protein
MPSASDVLATVNGTPVKVQDVSGLVWQIFHKAIEHDIVDYLMVKSVADEDKVTATDEEVSARVTRFLDEDLKPHLLQGQTLEQALQAQSFSDARLFIRSKTLVLLEKIELLSFDPKRWIRVSTLVFPTPGKKPEIMKSEGAKALDFYSQLQKGATWDKMLTQVTTDPNVLRTKGDIGWHSLDAFPQNARNELTALKVGEVSHPIETPTGIQIFRLDALGASATGADFDTMRKRFIDSNVATTINAIRAKSKVVYTNAG